MNEQDAAGVAAETPQESGLSVRGLWQVFVSPTQFFQKLKDQPKILVPYVAVGILACGFFLLTADLIQKMQIEAMAERLQGQQMSPQAQSFMKIMTVAGGTVALLIEPILIAALALFWGNFVFAGKARYSQMLSVALFSCVLYAVGMWLTLPMILAKGNMMASYSLGILAADKGPTSFMYQLLSRISLFHIWQWAALGIGFAAVLNVKLGRGITVALLSSGLLSAINILFSAIGSMMG